MEEIYRMATTSALAVVLLGTVLAPANGQSAPKRNDVALEAWTSVNALRKDAHDALKSANEKVLQLSTGVCRDLPELMPDSAAAASAAASASQAAEAAADAASSASKAALDARASAVQARASAVAAALAASAAEAAAATSGKARPAAGSNRPAKPTVEVNSIKIEINDATTPTSAISTLASDADRSCRRAIALAAGKRDFLLRVDALKAAMESDLDDCDRRRGPGERSCEAVRRKPDLDRLKEEWRVVSTPSDKRVASADVEAALKLAQVAQKRVDERKSAVNTVLPTGDKAAAEAIRKYLSARANRPGGDPDPLVTQALHDAHDALSNAFSAFRATKVAQDLSNDLVDAALLLAVCNGDPSRCPAGYNLAALERRAVIASKRLQATLDAGKTDFENARQLRWRVLTSGITGDAQARAIRFLQLQEDNDNAKALMGKDAALISAGTADAKATLRLSFSEKGDESLNRFNVSFSTPLSKSDETPLWRRNANGLDGRPAVTASWNRFFMPRNNDIAFGAFGVFYRSSRERLSYVDPSDLSAVKKLATRPESVGLSLIGTPALKDAPFLSLLVERQRTWKQEGESAITCPVGTAPATTSVSCLSGRLGEPVPLLATVSTVEFRRQRDGSFDYALSATYNGTTRLMDVSMPLYLFKSSAEADKGRKNSGLSLTWRNKGRGFEIAVFVGAPLSLTSQ